MARRKTDLDALADIVQEVRSVPTPELDWERIEGRLEALPPPRATEPAKQNVWFWAGVGTLAAGAATAATLLLLPSSEEPRQTARVQREQPALVRTVDGDRLAVGAKVTADAAEVSVVHQGLARWVLAPNSAATLFEKGETVTLRLESGAVVSHVVKSSKPITFAIQVGEARVSVHGTVFRVERRGERAIVDVTEGVVAVSEALNQARPRFVLRGPSHGDFALDGRTGRVEGNAERLEELGPSTAIPQRVNPAAPADAASANAKTEQPDVIAPAASAAPEDPSQSLPLQPSIGEIEAGVSSTMDAVTACFRERTEAGGGVRVTARTFVTLDVNPDGVVRSVAFAPRLAPAVELCSREKLASINFARSREGVSVKRWLELKR